MKQNIFLIIIANFILISNSNSECLGSAPNERSRFEINENSTVLDKQTGLMWKQCTEGYDLDCSGTADTLSWSDALMAAKNSNFAGYTDWRVPNIKELRSIVNYSCHKPSINESVFPNTGSWYYWSSTPYAHNPSDSWRISFDNGQDFLYRRDGEYLVRLVRDSGL